MKFTAVIAGSRQVTVERLDEKRFRVDEKECVVDVAVLEPGVYSLIVEDRQYEINVRDEKKSMSVEIGSHLIPVRFIDPSKVLKAGVSEIIEGEIVMVSPMPGRVVGIKFQAGEEVKEGDGIIVVEAMKMENELHAPKSGRVKKISVKVGDAVEAGQDLVAIE